jgi:hypothetical protein
VEIVRLDITASKMQHYLHRLMGSLEIYVLLEGIAQKVHPHQFYVLQAPLILHWVNPFYQIASNAHLALTA